LGAAAILPRGVEAHIQHYAPRGDGTSDLTLVGTRLFDLVDIDDLDCPHGRLCAFAASVRWLDHGEEARTPTRRII